MGRADKCVVSSARWLAGGGTKVRRGEQEGEADVCAEPNAAEYELDGVVRKVKIPEGLSAEVEQWLEDGLWEKLAKLEEY